MNKSLIAILATALVILFSGCNKTPDNGPGRLTVKITDAPFPINFVESASVTITKVELRKEGDCVSDGSPFLVVWEGSATYDLHELRNGLTEELINLEIPQGKYDLVRLYVDQAELKIKDGGTFNVKVPSGKQTGIKIFIIPALNVAGGLTSELLLDFDLSRSFVMRGNMKNPKGINGFIFKPVIRAVNNTAAGSVKGSVKAQTPADSLIGEARIYVLLPDSVVAKTIADKLGHYAITGLNPGTYSMSAVKESLDSVIVDDVKVVEGNWTIVNFVLPEKP